jgi:hypothetical protein
MRTRALSSSVSAFSGLLASVCLRYGVAKPSVWPCRRACNRLQISNFRSDSPLNFAWFWFPFGDLMSALRVCGFVRLLAIGSSVPTRALQYWTTARSSMCFLWNFSCLILRWKSGVNRVTVSWPLYSRVCDSGTAVCGCSDERSNRQRLSTTHRRSRSDLGRC